MKMTGAEMVVKILEKQGVSVVFGYPGAANCPIIDKMSHSNVKHILVRNEQGAAHMASGYACATKTVGVCTATSGPGATNLITGIATAYMDSVPIVALTGQVATPFIGKDAFQEVDITGATIPFTKHNYLVKDIADIPRVINEAFFIATTGRPGPVLVDLPMDLLKQEFDFTEEPVNIRGYKVVGRANESQVRKVAEAIKAAKKPVVMVGGGVNLSNAVSEFRKFVYGCNMPVLATMMGIGAVPTDNALYCGMVGSHGVKYANQILNRSDLVVIMGARLGDRAVANASSLEKRTKLIHIDIDPAEIGKNMQPIIPVVGDVKDVLTQLIPLVSEYKTNDEWIDEINTLKEGTAEEEELLDNGFVNPKYFIKRLSAKAPEDAFVSTEVGQNQIWVANNYTFRDPKYLITSAGFGTMGYGLPSAIGASVGVGEKGKTVISVMGDGSFQMDLPELGTMCQWGIDVKMIVFKNDRLGMVHEHQFLLYKSNYQSVTLEGSPDFCKLADAYGIPAEYLDKNSKVDEAIDTLLSSKGSFMLVVSVDPFEPTGGSLNERRM